MSRNGRDDSAIGFYCYHADMRGKYGDNLIFTPRLEHGRWYRVEMHCKLNTPGRNDGVLRGRIDGIPAFERTDLRFRDVDTLKIEEVWVNVYHGGEEPVPEEDIHLYLDNLVISRQPIAQEAGAADKPWGLAPVTPRRALLGSLPGRSNDSRSPAILTTTAPLADDPKEGRVASTGGTTKANSTRGDAY